MPSPCAVKAALVLAYSDQAKAYCEAVTNLHEKFDLVSKPECDRLMKLADDARLASEQSRTEMETHIRQHEC